MDIVERLRDDIEMMRLSVPGWMPRKGTVNALKMQAADEIESLRQQLAECERERDDLRILNVNNIESNIELEKERDELVAALEKINNVALGHPYAGCTCGEIARAALAKLGADKGEQA